MENIHVANVTKDSLSDSSHVYIAPGTKGYNLDLLYAQQKPKSKRDSQPKTHPIHLNKISQQPNTDKKEAVLAATPPTIIHLLFRPFTGAASVPHQNKREIRSLLQMRSLNSLPDNNFPLILANGYTKRSLRFFTYACETAKGFLTTFSIRSPTTSYFL